MRIAIVNVVWDPRAPTADATLDRFTTLTNWADALVAAGRSTEVAVWQRFTHDAESSRSSIAYHFVADAGAPKPSAWFRPSRRLIASIASFHPDLVHVNGLDHPRLVRQLRRSLRRGVRIVVQDHGGFDPRSLSTLRKAWMRRGLAAADALLVATPPQIDVFRASGLAAADLPVHDVMEGSTMLSADDRRERHQPLSVLWVGRLNANKDPLTVLEGFARFLTRSSIDATLTFVFGSAELEPALRAAIESGPHAGVLRSRVRLVGAVPADAIGDYYEAADVFALGSRREGSGYAVLEALACGVAPVVTDIPSLRWLTAGGQVGALWRAGDPASLADALERVAVRPTVAERQACRARFATHFSWPAIGRRAMSIYRQVARYPASP
jgi:glycosyltransferase involved in cell wall biosynthesis